MSLPHEYEGCMPELDADGGVMGMIESMPLPIPSAGSEAAAETSGSLHVNRSTLILPDEEVAESSLAMRYLEEHSEINHILLTGSDGLGMPVARLREILSRLAKVEHVRMIRLSSSLPAQRPERIAADRELLELLASHSAANRSIYVMMRFHLPEELNDNAAAAFRALSEAGASLIAEVPIVAGVNADPDVLAGVMTGLTTASVIPYQFTLDRPGSGRVDPGIALEKAYRLAEAVKSRISGPARRARLTIMHSSGYYEILAVEKNKAYVKGHISGKDDNGRFMIVDCPPGATSFDERTAAAVKSPGRTGKFPSEATYLKVPYEIPD